MSWPDAIPAPSGERRASPLRGEAGVTLLEALIVLVLAGALAAGVGAALFPDPAKRDVTAASASFQRLASIAQSEALRTQTLRAIEFDPGLRELRVLNLPRSERLPASVETRLVSAAELAADGHPRIVFFPDGSATGATLAFRSGAHTENLRLNWLTGRIDHAPPGR